MLRNRREIAVDRPAALDERRAALTQRRRVAYGRDGAVEHGQCEESADGPGPWADLEDDRMLGDEVAVGDHDGFGEACGAAGEEASGFGVGLGGKVSRGFGYTSCKSWSRAYLSLFIVEPDPVFFTMSK